MHSAHPPMAAFIACQDQAMTSFLLIVSYITFMMFTLMFPHPILPLTTAREKFTTLFKAVKIMLTQYLPINMWGQNKKLVFLPLFTFINWSSAPAEFDPHTQWMLEMMMLTWWFPDWWDPGLLLF